MNTNTKKNIMLYGYNLAKNLKFKVSLEEVTEAINCVGTFSDNYFVYANKRDRDIHYNKNNKKVLIKGLHKEVS